MKAGSRLRTQLGELAIESVEPIDPATMTDSDAQRAGYESAAAARAAFPSPDPERLLYRVRFHLAGPDARVARRETLLDEGEIDAVRARLERFDRASTHGAWTVATLRLIGGRPAVRAGDLAEELGFERLWWKTQVRKLKELGLTESLEVGYRLSPRGEQLLASL